MLRTALEAGASVQAAFVAAGCAGRPELAGVLQAVHDRGGRVFELAPGVLERVADTVTPQPVLAVVAMPEQSPPLHALAGASFVVVCADVRDPGNTGAVIRAADAAGADAVVCCQGTADPFNPKTVRASAGSVLHLPVLLCGPPAAVMEDLGVLGLRRLAALAHGGTPYTAVDMRAPVALVVGNEASGLPPELGDCVDERVSIPMGGEAESLNVSLAAAVLCFEVRRQRSSNLHGVEER